jgi:hypothetical protein
MKFYMTVTKFLPLLSNKQAKDKLQSWIDGRNTDMMKLYLYKLCNFMHKCCGIPDLKFNTKRGEKT